MSETIELLVIQWLEYLSQQGKGSYTLVAYRRGVRHLTQWFERTYEEPCGGNTNAILWTGSRGSLTQPSSILRLLDKYCIQANIPKVTPHQLRHTFATRYLQKNPGDLRGLAALLGHSDLNTVRLYTEPSLDELAQRMEFPEGARE
jgi:site-specific recombinase XerD